MTGRHPYDYGWPDQFGLLRDDDPDYDPDPLDDELEDWYLGLQEEDARTDKGAN